MLDIFGFKRRIQLDKEYNFVVPNEEVIGDVRVNYLKKNYVGDTNILSVDESLEISYNLRSKEEKFRTLKDERFCINRFLGGMPHIDKQLRKGERIDADVLEVLACQLPFEVVSMIPKELR